MWLQALKITQVIKTKLVLVLVLCCFAILSELYPDISVFHSHDFLFQAIIRAQPTAISQILMFFVSMR